MKPFEKCPICGGELAEKEVEKLLRGGMHTAVLDVKAHVCLKCGARLYSPDLVRKFEDIRCRLEDNRLEGFQTIDACRFMDQNG
ncbi:MAG: YgiT-type zinc finger protein [Candidatus Rokubacteria bacterium]|nr:YgiT-type zinc finger protein [Candidatus Rokubacteria bacterium]